MKEKIPDLSLLNVENIEGGDIEIKEDFPDVIFNVPEEETKQKASLQCELDEENNVLIARIIIVEKDYLRQGLGTKLFIKAIEYAKNHNLTLVTDYGVSEDADRLIQSLILKGYNFVKNPQTIEKMGTGGKRLVTFDGSPVYSLED